MHTPWLPTTRPLRSWIQGGARQCGREGRRYTPGSVRHCACTARSRADQMEGMQGHLSVLCRCRAAQAGQAMFKFRRGNAVLTDHPGAHVHTHATCTQAQYCTMPYHTFGARTLTLLMLELMRVTVTTAACKGPPPDHPARVNTKGPSVSEHNWGSVPPKKAQCQNWVPAQPHVQDLCEIPSQHKVPSQKNPCDIPSK